LTCEQIVAVGIGAQLLW